jgi:ABC-type cobalamin transport system permease subunit
MYMACVIEMVLAIGLVFGIYTTYAGAIAFIHLVVAAAAVWRVTGGKWLRNIGGYEACSGRSAALLLRCTSDRPSRADATEIPRSWRMITWRSLDLGQLKILL